VTAAQDPWWPWPLLTLVGGVVLGLLLQRLAYVWLTRRRLDAKARGLERTYAAARSALALAPGDGGWKESTLTDVAARSAELRERVRAQTSGAWLRLDPKLVAALDAALDAADAQVASLAELGVRLPALGDAIGADPPALGAQARAYLERAELTAGELPAHLAAIARAEDALAEVARLGRRATALARRVEELQGASLSDVAAARSALAAIRAELATTEEADRLPELDERLDVVEDDLAGILGRLPQLRTRVTREPGAAPAAAPPLDRRGDDPFAWIVAATATLVGVVAGFGTLYAGKPFGTAWDYLTLFVWGLATPVAAAALARLVSAR
jgi:hypothetical protein